VIDDLAPRAPDGDGHDAGDPGVGSPMWPAFADVMTCLFGLFVLFFVWAVALQVKAADAATKPAAAASASASAAPSASTRDPREERAATLGAAIGKAFEGRVRVVEGRIGIGGSVLFEKSSADLRPEGTALLAQLAAPLAGWLASHDELLMVSGFTDDLPVQPGSGYDNWALSSDRAVCVVRALVAHGVPKDRVFAAGFGEAHPVASNATDEGRAKNRRVEIAPVPRR
jgi:flagellar motor protein MotB